MTEGILQRLLSPRGGPLHFLDDLNPIRVVHTLQGEALRSAALRAASMLRAHGVKLGDRVLLCVPTGPAFPAWFLGAMWLGAVPVPLPAVGGFRPKPAVFERLDGVVADCAPGTIIAERTALTLLERYASTCVLLPADEEAADTGALAQPPMASDTDEDVAFLQYTAGSTGTPKGVVVLRRNLRANLQAIGEAVRVRSDDKVLAWLPLFHDMGLVGALLFSLYWGLPLFLYSPSGFVQKPAGWLRALSEHGATLSPGPHFAFGLCARRLPERDLQGLDLSRWRLALDGSEPIRPTSLRLFVERFEKYGFRPDAYHPVYGMSEATLAITLPPAGEGARFDLIDREALAHKGLAVAVGPEAGERGVEFVSVGVPVPGHAVEIRNLETGAPCPERTVGQVCFSGPSVTPRYFAQGAVAERERLETGDLGYLAEGRLYVVDRAKDLIIHAGANYYPSDLERTVESVEGVKRGRVVAFGALVAHSSTEGVVIAAEISTRAAAREIAEEVRARIASTFGLTLDALLLLPARTLPLTLNGKLMRERVQRDYLAGRLTSVALNTAGNIPR